MKVGDLVKLSAYGMARKYNNYIVFTGIDQVGIITGIKPDYYYRYSIRWTKANNHFNPTGQGFHSRREIKYADWGSG